ncbi:MAG: branched-chain amino acid aminotransferase [Bacteroidetes bacterium]|nr:branched-chain amino acid aminotransferase [Bacteroidota bacterium]
MTVTEPKSLNIGVEKTAHSRLGEKDFTQLPFGSVFSDHMFVVNYADGQWQNPRIMPFGDVSMSPSISAIHYGQSIFEGMKAYRDKAGRVNIFRIKDHLVRLNRSAERLCMPQIPEDVFTEGLKQLVALDQNWVPTTAGSALYLRPIFFATDTQIGVRPSSTYALYIITNPANAFYTQPVKVWVESNFARASEGGVGYVKTAGNYARSMLASQQAKELGFDVVLWLDAQSRRFVEEFSTMNAFFVMDDFVVTPRLNSTILAGITRDSIITLLKDEGITVFERDISIEEVMQAGREGQMKEVFGSGTAAVVMPVASITYEGQTLQLQDSRSWKLMNHVSQKLAGIRAGELPDTYGWLTYLD